jgi:hypothetical protein
MSRSQERACYPESSHADGCFPENDTTPSRLVCWLAGSPDAPRPSDLLSLFGARDQRKPAPRRGFRRGRPGGPR